MKGIESKFKKERGATVPKPKTLSKAEHEIKKFNKKEMQILVNKSTGEVLCGSDDDKDYHLRIPNGTSLKEFLEMKVQAFKNSEDAMNMVADLINSDFPGALQLDPTTLTLEYMTQSKE